MGAVEDQFDVEPIVFQQDRIGGLGVAFVADEFRGLHQRHVINQKRTVLDDVAARIGVRGAVDREGFIQKHAGAGDDACTASPLIAAGRGGRAHGIGAVEAVIQTAPAGVGRIQRIARVGDRDHQLRPRH